VTRRLRIFVSSPGDVKAAREIAALTIERLAQDFARFFKIEPYLWEYEAMIASGHFQDSIEPPSAFDIVVLILWSRLGTHLPERTAVREYRGIDGRAPLTGTEWEFEEALQATQKSGAPDLLVYRSRKPAPFDTQDPDRLDEQLQQLKALNSFWERHFANQGMFLGAYTSFTSDAEFAAAFENHLRKLIEKRIAALGGVRGEAPTKAWAQAPFRGLETYEFEHALIFFGQDEALAKAMLQLTGNAAAGSPFLLVLGASGSGKSSLVKAGVVPKLFVPRRIAGTAFLRRILFRPSDAQEGEDLFDALARRLTTQMSEQEGLSELIGHGQSTASLAEHLRNATATPAYPIGTALGQLTLHARQLGRMLEYETAKLVVVVDQLEELFTGDRISSSERTQFIELLAGLVRSGCVWVVATMRIDFWHRATETPELVRLSEGNGRLELLPPGPAQLSQMIRRPAEAAGVSFELHETTNVPLNDAIVEEVAREPGALPLLSYLLNQLYRADVLEADGTTLTYATYEKLGRLEGAIATQAEAVLERCTSDDRKALGSVLFSLVEIGAAEGNVERALARRVPLSTFPVGSPQRRLVEALLDPGARLLVSDTERGGSPTVRVAHEALISRWAQARDFVQSNAEALKIRHRIEERYLLWRALKEGDPEATQHETSPFPSFAARLAAWRSRFGREQGLLTDIDVTDGRRLLKEHRTDTESHLVAYIERSVADNQRIRTRSFRVLSTVAIVVTLLAVVSIIAGLIAAQQRDRARTEAATADRTSRFMVSLFKLADPGENRGNSVTVREVLDRGARDIGPGLKSEPRIQADLLTAMGEAYTGLGLYDPARKLLTQAQVDQQGISVPPESRVRTLIASGSELYLAADYGGAKTQLRGAVEIAQSQLPADSVLTSEARDHLADVLVQLEQYPEAERLCQAALKVDRKRGTEGIPILARTLSTLANAFYFQDRLEEAEPPMREALALRKQCFGSRDARTAESMNNLGSLLYQTGRYAEAATQWQKALPVYREVYGPEHPEVATLLNNLGRSALMAGRVDEAIPLLEQAVQVDEKLKGLTHDDLVPPLNSLGMAYLYEGDTARARIEISRALQIARLRNSVMLDQLVLNAADLELSAHRTEGASPLLDEARRLLETRYPLTKEPAAQWRYAAWDAVNADFLALEHRPDDARATFARARDVLVKRFGPQGFYVLRLDQRAAAQNLAAAGTSKPE
jgi:tetratricopeptide (TPR) repeat protein